MNIKVKTATIVLRLCFGGVEHSRTRSAPASLRITSLISSSRFGVWGLNDIQENVSTGIIVTQPYTGLAAGQVKMLTRGCRGPYFSMALLNGVGVRGVKQRSDLWLGVTKLHAKCDTQNQPQCILFILQVKLDDGEGASKKIISYTEFSFWVRGVLSRCSGVVTMAFWLHTGVEVRDGFSKSWLSCFVHMLRNWKSIRQVSQIECRRQRTRKKSIMNLRWRER